MVKQHVTNSDGSLQPGVNAGALAAAGVLLVRPTQPPETTDGQIAVDTQTPDLIGGVYYQKWQVAAAPTAAQAAAAARESPTAFRRSQVYRPICPLDFVLSATVPVGDGTARYLTSADIAANPQWAGTYATTDTWDYVALQEGIYAAFATQSTPGNVVWNGYNKRRLNRELKIPAGEYLLSRSLQINDLVGGRATGVGRLSCHLSHVTAGQPAVVTNGCARSKFDGISFKGFDLNWDKTHGPNSGNALQSNTFQDCYFYGTSTSSGGYGLRIGQGDYMGSENTILNCSFANAWNGLEVLNYNALQNTVIGGNFSSCKFAGVFMLAGSVDVLHAGFQADAASQWATGGADVVLVNSAGTRCSVQGCRSEGLRLVSSAAPFVVVEHNNLTSAYPPEVAANTAYTAGALVRRTDAAGNVRHFSVATAGTTGGSLAALDAADWTTFNYFQTLAVGTAVFTQAYVRGIEYQRGSASNNRMNGTYLRPAQNQDSYVGANDYGRPEAEARTAWAYPDRVSRPWSPLAVVADVTGTAYTVTAKDYGHTRRTTTGSAIAVTLPATAPAGARVSVIQGGTGQVTFATASGGSLANRQGHTRTAGQYARCELVCVANAGGAAVWVLSGDTTA